jgi:nitrogen regulatory protein P-II 1
MFHAFRLNAPKLSWSRRQFMFPTYERSAPETSPLYRAQQVSRRPAASRAKPGRRGKIMKLVVAIIKPHQVEMVTGALDDMDVNGMTLTEVRGHGRQRGHTEVYRGGEYKVDFLPKVRIEVLTNDEQATEVANLIVEKARTGKIGDGKLWVLPVEMAVRIRTGEVGDEAI